MAQPSGDTDEQVDTRESHPKDKDLCSPHVSNGDAEQLNAETTDSTASLAEGDIGHKSPQVVMSSLCGSNKSYNNATEDLGHEFVPLKDVEGITSFCNEIRAQQQWQIQLTQYDRENTYKMWAQLEALQNLCHDTAAMGMQHAKAVLSLGVRMDVLEEQVSHLLDEPGKVTSNGSRPRAESTDSKSGEGHDALQQYAETALKVSTHVSSIETRMDQIESRIGAEVQRALREFGIGPSPKRVHTVDKDGIPRLAPFELGDRLGKVDKSVKERLATLGAGHPAASLQFASRSSLCNSGPSLVATGGPLVTQRSGYSGGSLVATPGPLITHRSGIASPLTTHRSGITMDTLSSSAGLLSEFLASKRSATSPVQQRVASQGFGYSPDVKRMQSHPAPARMQSSERRPHPLRMQSASIPIYRPKEKKMQVGGEQTPAATSHIRKELSPIPNGGIPRTVPLEPSGASASSGGVDEAGNQQAPVLGAGKQLPAKIVGSAASLFSSIGSCDSPLLTQRFSLGEFLETPRVGPHLRPTSSASCDSVQWKAQAPHTITNLRTGSPKVVRVQSHSARTLSSEAHPAPAHSQKATTNQITRMVSPVMRMHSLSIPIHKAQALMQVGQVAVEGIQVGQVTEEVPSRAERNESQVTIATLESVSAMSDPKATDETHLSGSAEGESPPGSPREPPEQNGRNLQETWAVEAVAKACTAARQENGVMAQVVAPRFATPTPKSVPRFATPSSSPRPASSRSAIRSPRIAPGRAVNISPASSWRYTPILRYVKP